MRRSTEDRKSKRYHRRRACNSCLDSKVGCDGKTPCARCLRLNNDCQYSYITRQPPKKSSTYDFEQKWMADSQHGLVSVKNCNSPLRGETSIAPKNTVAVPAHDVALMNDKLESIMTLLPQLLRPKSPSRSSPTDKEAKNPRSLFFDHWALAQHYALSPLSKRELSSVEQVLYHPDLVVRILYEFSYTQVRLEPARYAKRIISKFQRREIGYFPLHALLAFATSAGRLPHFPSPHFHRPLYMEYFERAREVMFEAMEEPSLDVCTGMLFVLVFSYHVLEDTTYLYNLFLLGRVTTQYNLHLIDSPNQPALRILYDPSDELFKEFVRRAFWYAMYTDILASCLIGGQAVIGLDMVQVKPVSDHLLLKVYELTPEDDHYPCIIPGVYHHFYGYASTTGFLIQSAKISKLRLIESCPLETVLPQFHKVNEDLAAWYEEFSKVLPIPSADLTQEELLSNPVHYTCIVNAHAIYHMVVVLLNVQNAFLGPNALKPEKDPVCYQRGLDSAHFFNKHCFPYYRRLPHVFIGSTSLAAAFLVGVKFASALPTFPHSELPYYESLIHDYVDYLVNHSSLNGMAKRYGEVLMSTSEQFFSRYRRLAISSSLPQELSPTGPITEIMDEVPLKPY
ncbi:hypothetical protein IWQ62_001106 [Dispira parvispora]|uniref:Zn(2)-C6 fungal-type domain-containing protein n=1 Tax=Dispira parvispora TaxID=1520584 RepID=A0A9W8ATC6_9FUNG|nr:hypothetical protein IWQ62_001106 [Dispira parvispora]